MENLLQTFFERDLSETEEQLLDHLLESSKEEAFQFLEIAKTHYLQTGLPNPEAPPTGGAPALGGGAKIILGGLTAVLVAGTVWWSWKNSADRLVPQASSVPISITAPATVKIHSKKNKTAVQKQTPLIPAGTVQPEPYIAGHKYGGLSVIVKQTGAGLITIRVLDSQGLETRLLFANILEKGEWSFSWDGRENNGQLAKAGIYQVETQAGKTILRREVEILREPTP